jgi:hypothetical protein
MSGPRPPAKAPSVWRRIATFARRLWQVTRQGSNELFHDVRPGLGASLARELVFVLLLLVMPFVLAFMALGGYERRGARRLQRRVDELWKTARYEAVSTLRDVYQRLRDLPMGGRVEIAPFGRFSWSDQFQVALTLYRCEVALGHFEQALALLASMPPHRASISMQVDCLLAMKKKSEAAQLLERSLHLDNWRGDLRRRLEALAGTSRRSFN